MVFCCRRSDDKQPHADAVIVKAETPPGGSSDERLSSSDLSEQSAEVRPDHDHDYEDIYLVREEAASRRHSHRKSSSASRGGSVGSSRQSSSTEHSTTALVHSSASRSGSVRSRAHSDAAHDAAAATPTPPHKHAPEWTEEDAEKPRLSHRHSLPHPGHATGPRALKRASSEPGSMCMPPPPPPPPPAPAPADGGGERAPEPSPPPAPVPQEAEEPPQPPEAPPVPPPAPQQPSAEEEGERSAGRQMVLPFIPPKFPSAAGDDALIKPSEYLRSLGAARAAPAAAPAQVAPPPPSEAPPPPPPPAPEQPVQPQKPSQQQPLAAISIHDLNSVQLRRAADRMPASKTLSAPARTLLSAGAEQPYLAQKDDLIAELKLSKDITGIKKLKVERSKEERQRQEKELITEISKTLSANSFVEKIPEKDAVGAPIPEWKRQMLAKKAAEKARRELEEKLQREAEEKRLQAIPPWKRQLLARNHEKPKIVTEEKTIPEPPPESNKENTTPPESVRAPEPEDDEPQIIPWRAQLRKTNSKLSLLE